MIVACGRNIKGGLSIVIFNHWINTFARRKLLREPALCVGCFATICSRLRPFNTRSVHLTPAPSNYPKTSMLISVVGIPPLPYRVRLFRIRDCSIAPLSSKSISNAVRPDLFRALTSTPRSRKSLKSRRVSSLCIRSASPSSAR